MTEGSAQPAWFTNFSFTQLAKRVDSTTAYQTIEVKFSNVFKELGIIGGAYTIKLKENVAPHALYTPRRVPFPLRDRAQKELENMEALGVISKVTNSYTIVCRLGRGKEEIWCGQICVDLKPLNENLKREIHPIPRIDEVLTQSSGATVFSKLDVNSGYWQIPLAEESRLLTTFITRFRR